MIPIPHPPAGQEAGKETLEEYTLLYPLFHYRDYGETYSWSIFEIVNHNGWKVGATPLAARSEADTFDIWPFYFSRHSPDASENFHAVVPLGGHIQDLFGYSQISFVLFPLYVQLERHGSITTEAPWPIVRLTRGTEHGFEIFPLFGHRESPGEWSRTYALWPFIWSSVSEPEAEILSHSPEGTTPPAQRPGETRNLAVLPFYASTTSAALTDRDFLWPFFGYTDRRAPYRYHETRYFWPFFVQGRGDRHYHNRWGPFYTHSVVLGVDKTWIMFPAFRRAQWQDGGIEQTRTQFMYFVYWKHEERKIGHPEAAPAYKTHYWPLLSIWDNGAGSRQWQALSPFEVFFPNNREIRASWSPIFALYTHSEKPGGEKRTSLLWNAVTWQSNRALGISEFHLGPLLSIRRNERGRRKWSMFTLAFPHAQPTLTRTAAR
ncbi:MAG TPA: hypothetical protein VGL42_17835 [Opitutaceae bacterium]